MGGLENIFEDARAHGCKVKFEAGTEREKNIVTELYPGRFTVETNRGLSEYIYSVDKLAALAGSEYRSKRNEISRFCRDYRDRFSIESLSIHRHLEELLDFQHEWLRQKFANDPDPLHIKLQHLTIENEATHKTLCENFELLGFRGIVLLIDGKIKGYAFGVPLSETCIDELVEKGDKSIPNISKVLFHEFAKHCCAGYEYINKEEDLGIESLRLAKMLSRPKFLLDKFILTEI